LLPKFTQKKLTDGDNEKRSDVVRPLSCTC